MVGTQAEYQMIVFDVHGPVLTIVVPWQMVGAKG